MTLGSNLTLRILAILLAGFILLQLLVWAVLALPVRGDDRRPYNLPRPVEVAEMVQSLETAAPPRRGVLLQLYNESLYTVRVLPAPPMEGEDREGLDRLRDRYAAALPGRHVRIIARRALLGRLIGASGRQARFFAPIRLVIALKDGTTLAIDSRPPRVVRAFLRQRSLVTALGGIILLVGLALAVRQTTRPLVRLSHGVRRFAEDLDRADLPIEGPREVRALSHALNDMKGRIRELMAERTRMLAGIAHDMRTYLTRLRLRAEFIDNPDQRARAGRDLDEMAALLEDTLLFARSDGAEGPPAARILLAEELASIVALWIELSQPVSLDPVEDGLAIRAAPIALRRILANLIDNGLRHGTQVAVAAAREDEAVVIRVADDGPGVPVASLGRLGEPFGRLDPSRDRETGGAGLGLAIVRALAERDGAQVRFANRAQGGFLATLLYPPA